MVHELRQKPLGLGTCTFPGHACIIGRINPSLKEVKNTYPRMKAVYDHKSLVIGCVYNHTKSLILKRRRNKVFIHVYVISPFVCAIHPYQTSQ